MHKLIGFAFILSGCVGLGLWYSMQFQKQARNLKRLCRILELLEGQIRYGRCTLPECCLQLAERVEEPYRSAFKAIYEQSCCNDGSSFGQLCTVILDKSLGEVVMHPYDKELFVSCFSKCGFAEDIMQLRNVEQVKGELEERAHSLSISNVSKCRLAVSLGTMSGLLLVILFL